jgi:hypothetical protein
MEPNTTHGVVVLAETVATSPAPAPRPTESQPSPLTTRNPAADASPPAIPSGFYGVIRID